MTAICKWSLSALEAGPWTSQSGPSINPTPPTSFVIEQLPGELLIANAGPKFAGALAKQSNPLPWPTRLITFGYAVKFGDDIAFAQVIETDAKITDAAGWTYDGSFQWNVASGWMAQIGSPWLDTGVKIPLAPDQWNRVAIVYQLDYVAHTLTVVSVNGQAISLPAVAAKQLGWGVREIVTQLQLCTNGQGGAYTARFQAVGYEGDN